jgi:hypothetical protein
MIVTFGLSHNAQDGTNLANRFVDLGTSGDDHFSRLRAIMLFGQEWAFLYDTEADAGVGMYDLTQYVVPKGWLAHSVPAHRDGKPCDTCMRLSHGVRLQGSGMR